MEGTAGGLHKRVGVPDGRTLPGGVGKCGRLGCLLRAPGETPQQVWFPCWARSAWIAFGVLRGVPAERVTEELGRCFLPAQLCSQGEISP